MFNIFMFLTIGTILYMIYLIIRYGVGTKFEGPVPKQYPFCLVFAILMNAGMLISIFIK